MVRYFFDLFDDTSAYPDDTGIVLPASDGVRRAAATRLLGAITGKLPRDIQDGAIIHVRDEAGQVIFTADLSLIARWLGEARISKIT